jgi:hypothetical protein
VCHSLCCGTASARREENTHTRNSEGEKRKVRERATTAAKEAHTARSQALPLQQSDDDDDDEGEPVQ